MCRLVSSTDAWATPCSASVVSMHIGVGWSVPPMPGRRRQTSTPSCPYQCRLVSSTDAWATLRDASDVFGLKCRLVSSTDAWATIYPYYIGSFTLVCRLVSSTDAWATPVVNVVRISNRCRLVSSTDAWATERRTRISCSHRVSAGQFHRCLGDDQHGLSPSTTTIVSAGQFHRCLGDFTPQPALRDAEVSAGQFHRCLGDRGGRSGSHSLPCVGWSVPPMPGRRQEVNRWTPASSVGWSVPPMPGRHHTARWLDSPNRVSAGQFHRCLGDTGVWGNLTGVSGCRLVSSTDAWATGWREREWRAFLVSAGQFHRCLGDGFALSRPMGATGVGWSVPPMPGRPGSVTVTESEQEVSAGQFHRCLGDWASRWSEHHVNRCRLVSSTDAWATRQGGPSRAASPVSAGQFHRCLGDGPWPNPMQPHNLRRLLRAWPHEPMLIAQTHRIASSQALMPHGLRSTRASPAPARAPPHSRLGFSKNHGETDQPCGAKPIQGGDTFRREYAFL